MKNLALDVIIKRDKHVAKKVIAEYQVITLVIEATYSITHNIDLILKCIAEKLEHHSILLVTNESVEALCEEINNLDSDINVNSIHKFINRQMEKTFKVSKLKFNPMTLKRSKVRILQ